MTKIGQTNQELKIIAQQNGGTQVAGPNADSQLRESFTFEEKQTPEMQKPLKAQDLDFSSFKKEDAKLARSEAREVIQDLEDQIDRHNRKNPNYPLSINYTNFPDPQKYNKEINGSKKEAYTAWADQLRHWERQERMRLDDAMDATAEQQTNRVLEGQQKLAQLINAGRYEAYIHAGITQNRIEELAQKVNYNFQQLEVTLNAEFAKTRNVVREGIEKVNDNTNAVIGGVHKHIDASAYQVHLHITEAKDSVNKTIEETAKETKKAIEDEGTTTRDAITKDGDKTRAEIQKLQTEIIDKLEKMPTKKSLVIDFIKGTLRLPVDIAAAGFDLISYIYSLPAEALKKLADFLSD